MLFLPLGGHRLEPVPGELVEDQRAVEKADELVQHAAEVLDVVERATGDNRVERAGIVERLDRGPPEDPPIGSIRVDGEQLVALGVQPARELAVAAAHLEDSRRGGRQLREYEPGEVGH